MTSLFRSLLSALFPALEWRMPGNDKIIYLTFDDGPDPEVTPKVLEQLNAFKAKATFFCVGNNVVNHPEIYNSILANGHATGNHTFHHVNAWKTNADNYIKDTEKAAAHVASSLFRPPYGKLTPRVINALKKNYRIIMWDVLTRDYDPGLSSKDCMERIKRNTREGSVIVFHDSIKAAPRMHETLDITLKHFAERGFLFKSLH